MPLTSIAKFEVNHLQILDLEGIADPEWDPHLSEKNVKEIFRLMLLARQFDDTCIKMQREGRMGTYPPLKGQEASEVASAFALEKSDLMFPSFREHAVFMTRGVPIHKLMLTWMGHPAGGILDGVNFPAAVPVGTQPLHAAGAGWGQALKNSKSASIVYFGDGATSQGDFHEALNFATTLGAHTVFFCQNNQYAISVPRAAQTCAPTLAQKGFVGCGRVIQVDGNDALAVFVATKEALDSARQGVPVLIESLTFRRGAHTTADEPKRYVSEKESKFWEARDPIDRFRKYLKHRKIYSESWEKKIFEDNEKLIAVEAKKAESFPKPKFEDLFTHVFAKSLPHQVEELKNKNTLP